MEIMGADEDLFSYPEKNIEIVSEDSNKDDLETVIEVKVNLESSPDIETLLKVPPHVVFPLELSRHLKEKLIQICEANWHLKKQIHQQSIEIAELRKNKLERKESLISLKIDSPSVLSSKVAELSRKNRDCLTTIENLKAKIQKLQGDKDGVKKILADDISVASSKNDSIGVESGSISQQLAKSTSKMIEYRRQNQLLQMELRTALRALAQEVGEGVTPKTVLKEVSDSSWRGRHAQITSLTSRVSELQLKLNQMQYFSGSHNPSKAPSLAHSNDLDNCSVISYDDSRSQFSYSQHGGCGDSIHSEIVGGKRFFSKHSVPRHQISNLANHDKKKQNVIERLTHELQESKNDLKNSQLESKGSKARVQFLESQVRSLRIEVDEMGTKLKGRQEAVQNSMEDLRLMRQELLNVTERERRGKESANSQIYELDQALSRERNVVKRLQMHISEKQDHLQRVDAIVAKLQDEKRLSLAAGIGNIEACEKIKNLENQLQLATETIQNNEKEREKLLKIISNSVAEAQQERQSHCEAEKLLQRSFKVLARSDSCINKCLDIGQLTTKSILEEVEEIRGMVRELKAGCHYSIDLYLDANFQNNQNPPPDPPKKEATHSKSHQGLVLSQNTIKSTLQNARNDKIRNSQLRPFTSLVRSKSRLK